MTVDESPYRRAAHAYWAAGWRGILPLPAGQKHNPPPGYTGEGGVWPSYADVQAWCDGAEGDGNIALRLPHDLIGIDVDHYGEKTGGDTLADAETQWGPLPPTWCSSSRDDGISGIRFYRVPESLRWPGELGADTELIQYRHRYALVWPSLHPSGAHYIWRRTGTELITLTGRVPTVEDFPALPERWIGGLTGGELAVNTPRNNLRLTEAALWLANSANPGPPCRRTDAALRSALVDLSAGSRHAAARYATMRIVRLAAEGHTGIVEAADTVRRAFLQACADPGRGSIRRSGEAEAEWASLIVGAVNLITADPDIHPADADPCDHPFGGLIAPGASSTALGTASSAASSITAPGAPAGLDPLVAQELTIQRARRNARRILDNEDAAAIFRQPPWRPTLTAELAIPDEPVAYTIEEIMPSGANVLLTSQFKTGKTTLVNHLTQCLVDKTPFLGRYAVQNLPGRVALWNYEVDDRQYRRWLRDLGIENTEKVTVLNLRGYRMPIISPFVEDWVSAWLAEHDIAVWIVDPFARAFTGSGSSENDNTEVGRFLDTLDVIKNRAGVSDLVMPTHTGRAEGEEGAERARGATRLDDWADVRWLLTKDEEDIRFFRATGRDVEIPEGRIDYAPLTRTISFSGGASRASERAARIPKTLLSVVMAEPGISHNQLREAVRARLRHVGNEAIDDARQSLAAAGRIRIERPRGPGQATRHYPIFRREQDDE